MSDTTSTVKVGETTYDLSIVADCIKFIRVIDESIRPTEVLENLADLEAIKWSDAKIAKVMGDQLKNAAKKAAKEINKVDHVKRFAATVKVKINANSKATDLDTALGVARNVLAAINTLVDTYNAANPDANLTHYTIDGGKVKSKAGGRGEGRNYNRLAELIEKHTDLWGTKPIRITYDARLLSYPVMWEDDKAMVQYTGPTRATFIDTRDKDKKAKPCKLVNGQTYPIGQLNQLNAWANGANTDDDGKANPVAAPNSWITCKLEGITIDEDGEGKKTITDPTIAQFYDRYNVSEDESGEDESGEDEE